MSRPLNVAFLGPPGTYSHQAAYDRFGASVEYVERHTITDVFNALSSSIPLALIPQENSLFGNVTETYGLLRLPLVGQEVFVHGEVTLNVQHCLLVRKGVKLADIRKVLSHEQALGQCRRFLAQQLPSASLVSMPSTAAAAQALSLPDSEEDSLQCAAICSRLCATIFKDLEILHEGIQDENDNFTRFYVLGYSSGAGLPTSSERCQGRALIRMSHRSSTPASSSAPSNEQKPLPNIATLLTTLGFCVIRIDRRPSLQPVPFHDLYFIELQEDPIADPPRDEGTSWVMEVERAVQRVIEGGNEACLLGTW